MDTLDSDPDRHAAPRPDLTPMIDLIFLLLVFLLLTTRFVDEEEILQQLLRQSGPAPVEAAIDPPNTVHIVAHPEVAPAPATALDAGWLADLARQDRSIRLRVGRSSTLIDPDAAPQETLRRIHDFLDAQLGARELPGVAARGDQDPVAIHCFSRLPWRYACWLYDAVRAYELQRGGDHLALRGERRVDFAPPPVRGITALPAGRELRGLLDLR